MLQIHNEDEENADYGRVRMYQAIKLKKELGKIEIDIPSEGTVRRIMEQINLNRNCYIGRRNFVKCLTILRLLHINTTQPFH